MDCLRYFWKIDVHLVNCISFLDEHDKFGRVSYHQKNKIGDFARFTFSWCLKEDKLGEFLIPSDRPFQSRVTEGRKDL